MTEKVAKQYKEGLGRLALKPSSGGVFEVRINGQDIYSKAQTGEFPDDDAIIAEVGALLASQT